MKTDTIEVLITLESPRPIHNITEKIPNIKSGTFSKNGFLNFS
jgi:hypothetical protein